MGEFFKRIVSQVKELFAKLDKTKRIVIGVVLGVVVASFVALFTLSTGHPDVLLFSDLSSTDFGAVTKQLDEMGYYYKTTGTTDVLVRPTEREIILTKLAQEDGIPKGIPGWKLFDVTNWTDTEKELDVKYMRALRDEVRRHIESLKNINKASVEIAISEDRLYSDAETPYTAAVTVHLADGYESLSRKEIKGIVQLVSRAVGNRLKPENVIVTDEFGKIISDFDDEFDKAKLEYDIIQKRRKLEEMARIKLLMDIKEGLQRIYSEDRIQIVRLNMDFNWDVKREEQEEYTPIEMEPDNPITPYSERKVKDSLKISEKNTEENFQGHGWNPEGPSGTESNTPPGYKASDDQFAKYDKKETIVNHALNKTVRHIDRDPYDVTKVSVAIAIDGFQDLPRLSDGSYDLDPTKEPVQTSLTQDELRKAENIVRKAINYDQVRGDQVAVENIMFDRTTQWKKLREELRHKEQMRRLVLAGIIGVVVLFIGFLLFRAIQRQLEKRRRLREEQLALEQQRMREAALRAAEDEEIDVELSPDERARRELLEGAIFLARERPEDVAKLLRTWLAED